jgi:hypothetical protein
VVSTPAAVAAAMMPATTVMSAAVMPTTTVMAAAVMPTTTVMAATVSTAMSALGICHAGRQSQCRQNQRRIPDRQNSDVFTVRMAVLLGKELIERLNHHALTALSTTVPTEGFRGRRTCRFFCTRAAPISGNQFT